MRTVGPFDELDVRLLVLAGRDFDAGDAARVDTGAGVVIGRVLGFVFNIRGSDPQVKEPFLSKREVPKDRAMGYVRSGPANIPVLDNQLTKAPNPEYQNWQSSR